MAKKKTPTPKPSKPITDAVQIAVWLDPLMLDAIDTARGEKTRAAFILETVASKLKMKAYSPRRPGRPATKTPTE